MRNGNYMTLTDLSIEPRGVRAILGLSSTELTDEIIGLSIYSAGLEENLYSINPRVESLYEEIVALDPASLTRVQKRYVALVRLYGAYQVALNIAVALPMLAVRSLTDGKAEFSRQTDALELMAENLKGVLGGILAKLLGVLAELDPTQPAPVDTVDTMMLVSSISIDPVTGAAYARTS